MAFGCSAVTSFLRAPVVFALELSRVVDEAVGVTGLGTSDDSECTPVWNNNAWFELYAYANIVGCSGRIIKRRFN